jgi:MATE family multidrug resistance protein
VVDAAVASRSRGAIAEVWTQAWPTVVTMTSYTVMQFVDSLMVAQIGPLDVAAQGNGGIWSFTPIAFVFGLLTVVNTFAAQNLGAGRLERVAAYGWAGLWISLATWVLVLLPFAAILPWAFAAVGHSPELVAAESAYGRIMLLGGVLLLVAKAMSHLFFGLHRPKVVTVAAIAGNVVNVFASYALVFGADGLPAFGLPGVPGVPALGLVGAALGTTLGVAVEAAIPLAVFLGPKLHRELGTRTAWRCGLSPIRDLLKVGSPAAAQFGNELVCWTIFMSVLVGRFGEDHMAAGWATMRYVHLSFMPAVGFSVATTALVGRFIGAGEPDRAARIARTALAMALVWMTACGAFFLLGRDELVRIFVSGGDTPAETVEAIVSIGGRLLVCAAVFQILDAVGIVYSGALRGAGDTLVPGVVTVLFSWFFIVFGGWVIVETLPGLESVGPWLAATAYLMALGVVMGWRFESGAWRRIRLVGSTEEEAARVAPLVGGIPAAEGAGSIEDLAEELAAAGGGRPAANGPNDPKG